MSRTKPYFSATFWATASSIVEFIDAKPPIWFSSEMSLNGFRLSAPAKSRTITGGLRWMILMSPSTVTRGGADGAAVIWGSGRGNDGPRTGRGGGPAGGGALAAGFGDSTGAAGAETARRGGIAGGALAAAGLGAGEAGAMRGATGRGGGGAAGAFARGAAGGRAGTPTFATATASRSRATSCAVFTKMPTGLLCLMASAGTVTASGEAGVAATGAAETLDASSFSISSM